MAEVEELLHAVDAEREALLRDVEAIPVAKQDARAGEQWSALQVVDHLVRSERGAAMQFRKLLREGKQVGVLNGLRCGFLRRFMHTSLRIGVPKAISFTRPREEALELDALKVKWKRANDALRTAALAVTPGQQRVCVFYHPIGGEMTVTQALRFLQSHIVHHRHQIRRIASA